MSKRICRRFDLFAEGHWDTLATAVAAITTFPPSRENHERTMEEWAMAALPQLGEVPELNNVTGATVAPETPTR